MRLGLLSWLFDAEPGDIEGRQEEQGEQSRDEEAADDGVGHRPPKDFGRDRYQAESGGGRGQHDRRPQARSMSIRSIRITELRMIMPLNAMMPRIATKLY
jgi:hypothetical protein